MFYTHHFLLDKNKFMKFKFLKIFFLFGFICFFSLKVYAIDSEETFLRAGDFYSNKKYKQALDLYESIDRKGPVIFYNIGNCKFRLEQYFDALVYYNRAKNGASFDLLNSIKYNINIVNSKLGVFEKEKFWQTLEDNINLHSIFKLQVLFLIFWFIFFILYIFLKKLRVVFLSINFIFIIVFGFFVLIKYRIEKYPAAISRKSITVYLGPSETYHKLIDISKAQKVQVKAKERVNFKKECKDWFKIKYNGITGWVLASDLEII